MKQVYLTRFEMKNNTKQQFDMSFHESKMKTKKNNKG